MKQFLCSLLCCLFALTSMSQQSPHFLIPAAGGYFEGSQVSQSWSLGEPVIETVEGPGLVLTQGFQQPDWLRSLSGTVNYYKTLPTPLTNTTVKLMQNNLVMYQTTSSGNGAYSFPNLPNGIYQLQGSCTKPWGGGNALDALLIMKHFTQMSLLEGLAVVAANVDGNTLANASDALLVMKRFVQMTSSFVVGDWATEVHTVAVNGSSNLTDHFKMCCYGDVDGSYSLPAKTESTPTLVYDGMKQIQPGIPVKVPVTASQPMELAALSLVISYPEEVFDIPEISVPYDREQLVWTARDGVIRMAWYSLTPRQIQEREEVFSMTILPHPKSAASLTASPFIPEAECQLADFNGNVLQDKSLILPNLMYDGQEILIGQNYPNPAGYQTTIPVFLPKEGSVVVTFTDVTGRLVAIYDQGHLPAGNHKLIIDIQDLSPGLYNGTFHFQSEGLKYSQSTKIVVQPR